MPVCLIEAPIGIRADARKRLVERITAALDTVYPIPDVRIFLREYPLENVARTGAPVATREAHLLRRGHLDFPTSRRRGR
jgi:hypothetical protein